VVAANAARAQEALRVLEEFGRSRPGPLAQEAASLRYGLYDLETELLQARCDGASRRERLAQCHLYLIVGPGPEQEAVVAAALRAGVRLVQYRAKEGTHGLHDRQRLREARRLRQLCAASGALFIVNDRLDLALAVAADGVHLGQDDLPTAEARRLLGADRLIGRSTHALDQLQQALAVGSDYVGVRPVEATPTKPGRQPVGLDYVRQAAEHCPIPFFAIGGIEAANLATVVAAGATRVAVVRAITAAADPESASRELLEALVSLTSQP
jgi:thiamine-phosphate pyrophosphorylase